MLATVTSVMAVSTLMQYSLSAISPLLIREFGLTSSEYGSLFTVYFVICAAGSLVLGGPTQRIGPRWGMALVGVTAGAGLLAVALAPNLHLVYLGLALSGIAGALSNPATNLALMHVDNRGPLIGIKQSGVQLSAVAVGVLVAPLAQSQGWRFAFVVCAVLCLPLIPAAWATHRSSGEAALNASGSISSTPILGLAIFSFLMGCGLASTIAYLPMYATEQTGLSAGEAGRLIGLFGLCAVAGRVGWGFLFERSDRFSRPETALGGLAIGAFIATIFIIAAGQGASPLIYLGTGLMGLTGAAWNGLVMTLVVTSTDPVHAGRASGRVQAAFFSGLCISPLAFGLVVDLLGSYFYAWIWTAIVYVLALIVARTRTETEARCRTISARSAP